MSDRAQTEQDQAAWVSGSTEFERYEKTGYLVEPFKIFI